ALAAIATMGPSAAQAQSQRQPVNGGRVRVAQASPAGSANLPATVTNALSQWLNGAANQPVNASALESLPVPAGSPLPAAVQQQPQPARPGFTIPLADSTDRSTMRVANSDGKISLAVRDAPLRHVLAMIAENLNLNLVFASANDVPLTATLDNVPIDQALDSLLGASGFTWSKKGDVIFVTSVATAAGLPADVQGRRVAVLELDFAAAADVDQAVKGMLSPVGQSWISESSATDSRRSAEKIVVDDLEPYLQRIEQYVAEIDQPPRQVLIQAHILEVDLSRDKRAGVDLAGLARVSGATVSLHAPGLANSAASPGFLIEATGGDLSPVIEALISTTDAKTLAQPRVLAVNGQESRIQIGEQLGFRVTTTTETSTLESVEFLDVGVVLSVTPRITRDGRVLMRIKPEVSSGQVNPDTGLPEEETTELETDVMLASGQGMVIGGLIQERDNTTVSKVPVLGSLPYAGFFFQRRQVIKSRSEIIVALVPHVLPASPEVNCRNEYELMRATTPLMHGPLCRYPRPFEPSLKDVMAEKPFRVARLDEPCVCHPPKQRGVLRRLPPVDACGPECVVATPTFAQQTTPAAAPTAQRSEQPQLVDPMTGSPAGAGLFAAPRLSTQPTGRVYR
ncbi:MAG: hypothetical protein AAGJ46_16995, partial [Planctomycetota bacterium]